MKLAIKNLQDNKKKITLKSLKKTQQQRLKKQKRRNQPSTIKDTMQEKKIDN